MSQLTYRNVHSAFDALRDRVQAPVKADDGPVELTPWALDPKLPLLEGRIKVWDPLQLKFVPFVPWEHQLEFLDTWINVVHDAGPGERAIWFSNVHVEKSRQMGDTVIMAYACLWVVTYHDAPLLMQHQDLGAVDDGGSAATWDAFFGKIRLMHDQWPAEIGKARLRFRGGSSPLVANLDHSMRFIVGEGATPDPGRGGRYAGAVIDEAARIVYGEQALAALARACPTGRVLLSTPKGEGNMYFRLRKERPHNWSFLRHHWTRHPVYAQGLHVAGEDTEGCELCRGNAAEIRWDANNPRAHRYPGKLTSPWYDEAVTELTDDQVAAELDIDYTASLAARVYPEFSEAIHVAADPIPFDPALPLSTAWDYGLDVNATLIIQESPTELRIIGEHEGHDLRPEENAAAVVDVMRKLMQAAGLATDEIEERRLAKQWTLQQEAIGDPAGDARELGSVRSLTAMYRDVGFSIFSPQQLPVVKTVIAVKRLLMGRPKRLIISPTNWRLIEHFKGNVWPTNKQGERKPGATQPLDNQHNHALRAIAYYTAYKYPVPDSVYGLKGPTPANDHSTGRLDDSLSYDMKL